MSNISTNNKHLQEFSVVDTDRAVNHMSQEFQTVYHFIILLK